MLRRALAISILVVLLAPAALAQDVRRNFPRSMRAALLGCWDLGRAETVRFETEGEHGVRAVHDLPPRPHGRPTRYSETTYFLATPGALQMECRPRSQHGQLCVVRLRGDGRLDVEVYARGQGGATTRRAEAFVAQRCDE